MLSLCELERSVPLLEARVAGHRVQGIVQPDAESVVLETYGPAGEGASAKRRILLSCRQESARVSLLASAPKALPTPPAFAQYLRAHVMGARVGGVRLLGDDRQLVIRLSTREGEFDLLLSIFGRRSNILLLDGEERIAAALRPLQQTRSELSLGDVWRAPSSRAPRRGEDRFADVPDGDLFTAIEEHYGGEERAADAEGLERRIEQALRKESKRLDRKLEKLEAELASARRASELEREGELLKSVLSKVSRGDTEVVARDFETGEDVTIALDPTLAPTENLERIFKRYHKALRSLTKAGALEQAVRESRETVAVLAAEFEELRAEGGDTDALEAFAARPEVAKVLPRPQKAPGQKPGGRGAELRIGKRVVPGRLAPRRYRTAGDLEIWVGRSDAGNDYLTTRLARGKDLFFHVEATPGSHVILRTGGRSDPPSEAVLDACELAVHFSKAKNATRADIHVVPIANVKKPKGAKPGLVMVHGGRTVHLRRIPKRLERALEARIED